MIKPVRCRQAGPLGAHARSLGRSSVCGESVAEREERGKRVLSVLSGSVFLTSDDFVLMFSPAEKGLTFTASSCSSTRSSSTRSSSTRSSSTRSSSTRPASTSTSTRSASTSTSTRSSCTSTSTRSSCTSTSAPASTAAAATAAAASLLFLFRRLWRRLVSFGGLRLLTGKEANEDPLPLDVLPFHRLC